MLRLLLAALLSSLSPLGSTAAHAQEWTVGAALPEPQELPVVPEDYTTVSGTFLRIHGPESETELLLRLARHGSEALPRLAERLEVPIGTTIHVYVARSDAEFRALQPGATPTWADATTWPASGIVFLRAPGARAGNPKPLEQVMDHELVHVLVGRAFGERRPPTWLQEGIARLLANEVVPDEARTLLQARSTGGIIALSDLAHGFPADPLRAELAYAEAGDFVAWLEETHGERVLPDLLRASAGGASMNEAVHAATGERFDEIDATWTARHTATPLLRLTALASGEWVWGLGALALVGAGIQRRRRFHRRLKEMGEEEARMDALLASLRDRRQAPVGPWTVTGRSAVS